MAPVSALSVPPGFEDVIPSRLEVFVSNGSEEVDHQRSGKNEPPAVKVMDPEDSRKSVSEKSEETVNLSAKCDNFQPCSADVQIVNHGNGEDPAEARIEAVGLAKMDFLPKNKNDFESCKIGTKRIEKKQRKRTKWTEMNGWMETDGNVHVKRQKPILK